VRLSSVNGTEVVDRKGELALREEPSRPPTGKAGSRGFFSESESCDHRATLVRVTARKKKTGRNDRCPCGSGKKYKKCHLGAPPYISRTPPEFQPTREVMERAFREISEHNIREQQRVARYGHVREQITTQFQGRRLMAVGSRIFYPKKKQWKFFPDFLQGYIESVFGQEWGETELAKPRAQRHPLMEWRTKFLEYAHKQQPLPDGTYSALFSGFTAAYLAFAYDLYIVEDNGRLDGALLARLKHPDQFQGARHELFVEATCLRAGFEIERENEKDGSCRHTEFTAKHKATGQKISVEAKSRHRPGVLGHPGNPEPEEEMSLRFGKLFNDAVGKAPAHPLVIFIDTNLPPRLADKYFAWKRGAQPTPSPYITKLVERHRQKNNGQDLWNALFITNHPHHYTDVDEPDPHKHAVTVIARMPKVTVTNPEALMAIHQAVMLYGNIPNEFPEEKRSTAAGSVAGEVTADQPGAPS
jgi:hypothetical protein